MVFNFDGQTRCDQFINYDAQRFKNTIVSLADPQVTEYAKKIANDALNCFHVFSLKICRNVLKHWNCNGMEYKPNAKALIQDLLIQDLMWNFFRHNWEGLKRFRGNTPAELGAYVRTCLVRLLTKYSKTMWSKMESLDASTVPDDEDAPKRGEILPASIPGPEAQYLKKEHKEAWKIMKKKLQSLISSLPPMEKAVFTRRFYKNMSSREVAQELYPAIEQKIGVNRVDVTYSHVKQNIGNILRNDEKLYALARATLNEGDVM